MSGAGASALYEGVVVHTRLKPRRHKLRYRLFWMLIDLDELDELHKRLRWFSRNRFNLFSFHDRDHLDGSPAPLRRQVEAHLRTAGIEPDGGAIGLLCVPRLFGYAFNPLSVYVCSRRDGSIAALLYEVNNTFGQRHCYVAAVAGQGEAIEQSAAKRFYVSPFMDMDLTYDFRVVPPGPTVVVGVSARDAEGLVIATAFSGERRDLSDRMLLGTFVRHPLVTLKIVGGIHWEALLIWRKGVKLRTRPPAPIDPVTVGHPKA